MHCGLRSFLKALPVPQFLPLRSPQPPKSSSPFPLLFFFTFFHLLWRETIAVPAVDDDDDEDDVAANAADFEFGMDRWMGSWINSEVDGWIGLWKYVGMIVDISVFYVYVSVCVYVYVRICVLFLWKHWAFFIMTSSFFAWFLERLFLPTFSTPSFLIVPVFLAFFYLRFWEVE